MTDALDIRREDDGAGAGRLVAALSIDGRALEAEITWRDLPGGVRAIEHTRVPREAEGRGIAGALTEAAMRAAEADATRVRPDCSYVAAWLKRHPEWARLRA